MYHHPIVDHTGEHTQVKRHEHLHNDPTLHETLVQIIHQYFHMPVQQVMAQFLHVLEIAHIHFPHVPVFHDLTHEHEGQFDFFHVADYDGCE